eukprot:829069-Rhodomonas_salina.1
MDSGCSGLQTDAVQHKGQTTTRLQVEPAHTNSVYSRGGLGERERQMGRVTSSSRHRVIATVCRRCPRRFVLCDSVSGVCRARCMGGGTCSSGLPSSSSSPAAAVSSSTSPVLIPAFSCYLGGVMAGACTCAHPSSSCRRDVGCFCYQAVDTVC